jgi:AraC-like DNA-binding protein
MELESRGLDCEKILNEFDLSRVQFNDESMLVAARTMYQLLDALADFAKDPAIAVSIGENLNLASWSLMRDAASNATTVGDFFIRFIHKARDLASKIHYTLEIKGDRASFRLVRAFDPGFCPQQADSFYVGLFYNIFSCLLNKDWPHQELVMQVCDPKAVPVNYRGLRVYACDNTGFRMIFPSTWLSQPIARTCIEKGQNSLSHDLPPDDFIEAISRLLQQYIHSSDLTVAQAAELCGYSQRRMSRLLKEQGTTLTRLIAHLREQEAAKLLLETDKSITEIAMAVGFSELSLFTRSFKRWTGQSPREYRRNQKAVQQ